MASHKFYKSSNYQDTMIPLDTYIWDKNYKTNYTRSKTFIYPYQYMCYLNNYAAQEGTSAGNVLCSFPVNASNSEIGEGFTSYKADWNQILTDSKYKLVDYDGKVYNPGYYKPGYCPSFKKTLFEYGYAISSSGSKDTIIKISKTSDKLEFKYFFGDQEYTNLSKTYYASDFSDGVIPSRVIIELVGGGGSGGSALWAVGGWGGNGGGAGGYICFVLNLEGAAGQWQVVLPYPVKGGSGNSGNGYKGGDAIVTPQSTSYASYRVVAQGGNGGTGGGGSSFAAGGSSTVTNPSWTTYFWVLKQIDGAKGGSQKGGHKGYNIDNIYDIACSPNIVNNTIHDNVTHKERGGTKGGNNTGSGQGTAGGGGASAVYDGANAVVSGMGDYGHRGSGGAGGSYVATYTPEGGHGGCCYFACYY